MHSSEQICFKQTSETVCTDGRVPDEIRESSRLWGRQLKTADGRKCSAGSEVLQVVDGWRKADSAESQHRRSGRSSPTGTVVGIQMCQKTSLNHPLQ